MTATPRKLYGGSLTVTAGSTLFTATAPSTVVTGVMICNRSAVATAITMSIDGIQLYAAASINAGETWVISSLRQVMTASAAITGSAASAGAVDVRISGVEIT